MLHESTESLAEYVRSSREPFRIVANGTWLDAGRPTENVAPLSVRGINGIVEYIPGDLTITVKAGTSLADINAATFREGQWLGLDPAGAEIGTIGATVATASVGPLVHGIGAVRDIVLGMEVVSGNGTITRSGGKVVKNVAGFDLVRLQTGAWGTLGIITEVSLRLRALPEVDQTVAIELDSRTPLLAHLVRLGNLTLSPLALELIGAPLATTLGVSNQQIFLIRLGGNETRVKAQRAQLATMGSLIDCNTSVWDAMRRVEVDVDVDVVPQHAPSTSKPATSETAIRCTAARVSHLPSQLSLAWSHVHSEFASVSLAPVLARATVSRGTVRVAVPKAQNLSDDEYQAAVAGITPTLAPPGGHVVWEQLPRSAWTHVPSSVSDNLSYGLQQTFDPQGRCNSGLLGAPFVP